MGGAAIVLQGCTSMQSSNSDSVKHFVSPQQLIVEKNINNSNGQAKEYIYQSTTSITSATDSLYPRQQLNKYCSAKNGQFTLLHKSAFSLVKDSWSKKLLSSQSNVKQGIGAYKCVQSDGKTWIVSIEPTFERKNNESNARVVGLLSKVMSTDEARRFYSNVTATSNASPALKPVHNQSVKNPPNKAQVLKESEVKKEAEVKKEMEPKKDNKAVAEVAEKAAVRVAETPQQQQLKSFVAARRDLNKGQNQFNACNNAQRAYNFGKLSSSGANVYAESGMLVARCLTSVPSYSSRFSNSNARAKGILQNLANNHNHAGAKHMLKQMN